MSGAAAKKARQGWLRWLLPMLACAPLLLYLYASSFSRLMGDDYGYFAVAIWQGFRDNFLHWWNGWHGSYSYFVAIDVLAPLDAARIPPVFPAFAFCLWLVGAAWLIWHALRCLQLPRDRLRISVALAALVVAASVSAFFTRESLHWFTAVLRHSLPVGIFLVVVAFVLTVGMRPRSPKLLAAAAVAVAGVCFVNAGLSELQALLHAVYLACLLVAARLWVERPARQAMLRLFATGWLASVISLIVQLSAPGAQIRMEMQQSLDYAQPVDDLLTLLLATLESSIGYIGRQQIIAGFCVLLAAGMAAALLLYQPRAAADARRRLAMSPGAWRLGLMAQVCLAMYWTLADARTGAMDASSPAPWLVLGAFAVSIAAHALALWRRRQLEQWLNARVGGAMRLAAGAMLAALALMAWTQAQGMPATAAACLFVSALAWLAVLCWQLSRLDDDARARQFGLAATLSLSLAFVGLAMPVAVGHYSLGFVFERSLTSSAFLLALPGLICGAYLGFLIQRARVLTHASASWTRLYALGGLAIVVVLMASVMLAQARLIPDFATYAREWDARHERILRLRDSGQRDIDIRQYSYDMSVYVSSRGSPMAQLFTYFYGVDSLQHIED